MNNLKQAIVASLTEHPDAEKYRQRAFNEDPAGLVKELARKQTLTKADFFATDDEGKSFIDSAGAWRNFDKITEVLRLGGESLTFDDFMAPLPNDKRTLLDSARANGGLAKVFTFENWKGRFEEMERLWYKLPSYDRTKNQSGGMTLDLKRQLLAFEGRLLPEDGLAKAGLSLTDLRSVVTNETYFNDVNRKLQQAGDYLRKDYVLMTDGAGDTMFDRKDTFVRFDAILKILNEHGERLEVKDYTRQLANVPSLLERAHEQNALNKVFSPAQWVDRLPDMLELWSNVREGWKRPPMTPQDFDNAYAEAEGLTYAKRFRAMSVTGKADLLTPINENPEAKPVLPLGLKVFWDNVDAVQAHLKENGESLTVTDLRTPSGQTGDSCLIAAAKFGCFDKVIEIAKRSGDPVTMADFMSKDSHGNTLISILAEKRQLSQVFTVDAWVGHVGEMKELWSQVAAAHRRQIDYAHLETAVKQATLKQKKESGPKIRPR
jgi:hypothetical protein